MKTYTKTGDTGTTSLFDGKRVKKSNKVIEALGAVDELNAWIGLLKTQNPKTKNQLQKDLMGFAAEVAGYKGVKSLRVEWLEKEIDRMEKKLPKLKNFILPRSDIHVARAVCRRAERAVSKLTSNRYSLTAVKYLNRLSDYLFVLARYEDYKKKKKEIIWRYGK